MKGWLRLPNAGHDAEKLAKIYGLAFPAISRGFSNSPGLILLFLKFVVSSVPISAHTMGDTTERFVRLMCTVGWDVSLFFRVAEVRERNHGNQHNSKV